MPRHPAAIEVTPSHEARVGDVTVRRALPRPRRRTVGAWCFADHLGPVAVSEEHGLDVGPHPHMGLHTATWLIEGEALHRDSLGTEQLLVPGALNLMTAGRGIAHSEEATGSYAGRLQGIQLWIAQPEETRHAAAAFEHHAELPRLELGANAVTVLLGALGGAVSPARRDTELVGADLDLATDAELGIEAAFEHALIVLEGEARVDRRLLAPGHLGYLGPGRSELRIEVRARSRLLLLGGTPFEEPLEMWWNLVGRSRAELAEAYDSWVRDDGRFGTVASSLERILTTPPRAPSEDASAAEDRRLGGERPWR
jgi:redox-sensitive bicupin YhaK (pirin superfamily)